MMCGIRCPPSIVTKNNVPATPTQKPLALLNRIIRASSNAGDVVLDPFCGSGTTLEAAHRLQRRYIGIDVNPEAVTIAQDRIPNILPLGDAFKQAVERRGFAVEVPDG